MRAASWVGLGLGVAGLGYAQAALALLEAPGFFAAWSLVAVGLFVAAAGARGLPDLGPMAFLGFVLAGLGNGYGIVLNPEGAAYLAATGAGAVGAFLAAGVAWRAWREAELSDRDVAVARVAFTVAGAAGLIYFVWEVSTNEYSYLLGDSLAAAGYWAAAWKLGPAARAPRATFTHLPPKTI